jgi:hypothetical protein
MHTEGVVCLCCFCLLSHDDKLTARLEELGSIFLQSFQLMNEHASRAPPSATKFGYVERASRPQNADCI